MAYADFYSDLFNICIFCSKILVISIALTVFNSSLRALNLFFYQLKGSKLKKDSVSQVRCRQALLFLSLSPSLSLSPLSHSLSLYIFRVSPRITSSLRLLNAVDLTLDTNALSSSTSRCRFTFCRLQWQLRDLKLSEYRSDP